MARYGFPNFALTLDQAGGTTPTALTSYITAINGVEVERILEEITAAGSAWEQWATVGMGRLGPIVLSGKYDDTATTGPDAMLIPNDTIRTLLITWGGSKTTSCEVYTSKYVRSPEKGKLTGFEATLQPTGTITEA